MKHYTEEDLKAAAALEPDNPEHLFKIGCLFAEQKHIWNYLHHSLDLIDKAIAKKPLNAEYHLKCAQVNAKIGNEYSVENHLKVCEDLGYRPEEYQKIRDELNAIKEQRKKSQDDYYQRMIDYPDSAQKFGQLGHHFCSKDKEKAYAYYRKALELDPNDREANTGIGRLYGEDGNMPKAIEHLKRGSIPYNEDFKDDHCDEIARMYEDRNDFANALTWRRKAVEMYPDDLYRKESMARSLENNHLYDEAADLYHEILEKKPAEKNRNAYHFLSFYYFSKNDSDNANYYIQQGLRLQPDDPYLLLNAGKSAFLQGETEVAEKFLLYSLAHQPDNEDTLQVLGLYYLADGEKRNIELSQKYFLKTLEVNPENLKALEKLALIYTDKGDLEKAGEYLRRLKETNAKKMFPAN